MKKLFLLSICFCLMLFLEACTIAKFSGRGAYPIMMNNPTQKVEVIKHVSDSKMVVFDYTRAFDTSELLTKFFEENKADAIINLELRLKSDVGTFFINLITLGLANAVVWGIEGDLVKMPQGLSLSDMPDVQIVASANTIGELMSKLSNDNINQSEHQMIAKTDEGFAFIKYK